MRHERGDFALVLEYSLRDLHAIACADLWRFPLMRTLGQLSSGVRCGNQLSVYRKDNFSEQVPLSETFVRPIGPAKGIGCRERNLELCCLHRGVETLKFAHA